MKENNLENEILQYLLEGETLTQKTCQASFGTSEVRHYISQLRKRGYDIGSNWINKNINGRKTQFKEYYIVAHCKSCDEPTMPGKLYCGQCDEINRASSIESARLERQSLEREYMNSRGI